MHAVAQAAATAPPPAANPALTSNDQINGNDFMTLLVAQLKNQDPTNPMDPTQFVGQLVSFNSLEQLISINQKLTPPSPGSSANSNPAAPPASSN